jgi:hypothetical protein
MLQKRETGVTWEGGSQALRQESGKKSNKYLALL